MSDLEKVIECLVTTIHNAQWANKTYTECDVEFLIKILALIEQLKDGNLSQQRTIVKLVNAITEKTPRLLQAADFQSDDADNGGAIPCWKEPKSPTRREGWAVIVYGKWLADSGVARYWTGKPSEKQKMEVKWHA